MSGKQSVVPHLKEVSKAKHRILEKYFPAWARILGSRNPQLVYVDCFAGPGRYAGGALGSPLIVLNKAKELVKKSNFSIILIFVEMAKKNLDALCSQIPTDLDGKLKVFVLNENSHDFIPELLKLIPSGVPAFFFIDPYGHPLTIPVINKILAEPKREVLLNLMWYAINRHLNNPLVEKSINRIFGSNAWKHQSFMSKSGFSREQEFLEYFLSRVNAKYKYPFRIRFSPEDKVPGSETRTKYYLVHMSNHSKAVLLMKEVMWPIGEEEGTFDYSATRQGVLFPRTPSVGDLCLFLERNYCGSGKVVSFDQLREETWELPFIEKQYRDAVKRLEQEALIKIKRMGPRRKGGIKGKDCIYFKGG